MGCFENVQKTVKCDSYTSRAQGVRIGNGLITKRFLIFASFSLLETYRRVLQRGLESKDERLDGEVLQNGRVYLE